MIYHTTRIGHNALYLTIGYAVELLDTNLCGMKMVMRATASSAARQVDKGLECGDAPTLRAIIRTY